MNLEKFYLLGKDFINDFDEDYEDFADNMQNPEYAKEFRLQLPEDGVIFGGKEKKSQKIDLGQVLGFTDEPRRLSNGVYIPSMTDYGIVMKNNSIDRLKHKPQVDIWDQLGQGVKRFGHDMTQQGQNIFNAFDYYGNTGDNNLEIHSKSSKISSMKEEYQDLLKTILTENPEFSPKLINELPQLKTIRETIKFLEDDLQTTIKSYTNEAVKKRDEFSLRDKNLSRMFESNPDADTLFSDVLGGIGTSIGLMAMSAPFGPASALAMTALGGLAEGQSMAQEVWNLTEGKGLTDEERTSKANAAFVAGNPIGWTEAVPLQRGINRIFKGELKKGWKDFAKKMALESLEEGIQEGFQTTAEEVTKASLVDGYKIQWNQIPYSALVGSLSGGVTAGGMYAANVATESYFELNDYINQQKKIVNQLHDSKVIDDKVYQSIKKIHKDKTRLDWKNDFVTHQNNLESLSKTEKTINKIKAGEDLTSEEEIALKQSKSYEDALKETKDPKAAFEQVLGNIKALEVSLTNDEVIELQKEMGTLESKRQDIKLEGRKALVENVFQDTQVYNNTLASISEKPNEWFLSQETEEGTKFIGEINDLIVSKDKTAKVVDKQGTVVKEVIKPNFTSTLEDVKDVFEPVMPNPITFHLEEDVAWLPTQNKVIENDVLESQKKHVQKVKTDTEIKLKEFEDIEVKESLLKFSKKIAYKANTTAKIDKVLKTKSVFQANPTEENLTQFASALVDFGIDPSTYIDPNNPIESALKKVQNDKISVSESWIPVVIETSRKVIDTYFEVKASLFQSNKSKYSVAEEVYEDAMQISAEIEQAIRSMKDSNKNIEAELEFYLYEGEMQETKDESIIEFFSELMLKSFETNNGTDKLKSEIKNLTPVINSTIDRVWLMYQQAKSSDLIIMSGNFIISSIAQANILKKVFNVNYIKPDSELEFSGLSFISVLQYDRIMNGTNEEEKQKLKDADLSRLPNNAFNYLLDTPDIDSKTLNKVTETQTIQKGSEVPSFNISSYEEGLGKKLTNFAQIPIEFRGKKYKSSEEAYQDNKKTLPDLSDESVYNLMVEVITAKLSQYPELVKEIDDKGGISLLNNATHNLIKNGKTIKSDRWTGKDGLFMKAFREAYLLIGSNNAQEAPQGTNSTEMTKNMPEGKKVSTGKYLPSKIENRLKRVVDDAKNWFNGWFVFDTVAYFGKTGFGANGVPAVNSKQFDKETVDVTELKYTGAILVDTLEDISDYIMSFAQYYRIAIVTREQLQRLKASVYSLFKRTRIYASSGKGYFENTEVNLHMADLTVLLYQNNLVYAEVFKEEKAIEQGHYVTNEYGKSEWVKTGVQSQRYYGMNLQVGLQENWQMHATALADHIIRAIESKKRLGENTLSINLTGNDLQYLNLSQEEVDNLILKFLDEVFKQVQDKIQREGNQTKINFRSGLSTGMEEAMFKWAMNQNILQDYSMDIAVPSNYRVVKSDGTIVYDMEEFFGRFGEKQEVKQENPKFTFLNKTTFESIFNNKEDIKSSYGKDAVISDWTDFVLEQLGEDVSIRIVKSDFVIPNTKVNLVGKRAAYHRGTVYINEDIIETPLEMYREVSHELTHQFLNNLLDTNASFYNEMLVIARDTFKFLRAHPEYIKNQADYDRILRYEATEQHKFVKEFVAYAMSNTSNLNQFMRMTEYKDGQSLWARFISKIKNFIRSFYGEQGKYPTLMQALENVLERRVGYKKDIQTMAIEPVLNEKNSILLALTNGLIETDSFTSSASVRSLGYEIAKANNIGLDDIPNGDHIAYLQTLTIQELQKQLYAVSGYRESLELIYEKSKKANEEFQDFEKAIITHIFNTINNLKRYNVIRPIGRAYTTPTGGKDYYYSIEELPLNYKDQEGTSKSSYFNDIRLNNTMEKLSNALGVPMKIAFVEQIEKIELNGKSTFEKVVRPGMNNSNNVNIINGKYLWIGNFGALNTAIAIEFNSEEDKLKVLDRLAQINEAKFGLDVSESETRIERLAVVLRLMVEDIRLGGQVGESFEEGTFVDNYKNTITRSTNMIKVFKRHYDLSPIFKPYYDKNKLDTFLSLVTTKNADQQPLGVVKGENNILFNAFFFDSIESNPNAEMTVIVDGIEQKFLLKDILTNEFGKETTDGAIFYLEGTFDNVYREAFGVRKNGVIKAWGSDIEGMMPLQLKGAYHKVSDTPNNLLAQWMKQNNVSMLVSSSAIKVHGSPVTGQDYKISDINDLTNQKAEINQLPLSMFNRQSEKETYENEGTGLSSGLSRNLFTKYNSIFKNNELNSVLSKVLTRTKKNLDKALLSISDSGLIETAVSILEKPSGSKMEQLISKMIANVIMGRGLMTPSEYETLSDDFKVGQSRLQEEAFKEIGVIFHEPFFAKMFQTHIKKKINEYLGWDIPSYWGVIRPDTGYLEANHVETASRTLRLKLQRKKKNLKAKIDEEFDSEYLYDNKKNLEEIIDSIEDEEDLKQYKSELKDVDKKIADYERKINLLNINIEKEFNDRYEEMIDIKTGRLKEGWCFVSSDMAKALSPMNQDRLTNEPEIAESKLKMINDLSVNQLIAEIFDIKGLNVDLIEAGDFSELAKASEGFKVLFNSPEYVVRELPVGNIEEITKLVRKTYPKLKIAFVGHVQTQEGINIALVDEKGVVTLLEPNTGQSADIIKLIGRETLKFRNTTYNQRVTSETIDDLNDKLQSKDLIATAIPTDSIFSQQPVRIAGVLDDIESSSVIVDSNHWQTRAGKDYDIDTLLFTYYDPKYWKNSNYKAPEELSSYEKAKAEYQNSHFMTVVRALRDGKKNLIKKMMSSYQERIPTENIDSEEKLYQEAIQVKYVQSFLDTTKGGDLSKLSEELFKLLDMYPKKVGGLIKEKAFYTFLGQLGLKTKISVSVPKTILDIYHSVTKEEINSTVEVDVDPTDSKRVTDMSMLFQRLLNDMVDKPTNTNSLYYEYEPDSFRMMTLKYGGNALPIVQKLEYFLKRNYYSILESGSDETIISRQEASQIEDFLGYLKGTLPKSITAAQEVIFGNPFNARKDVHSINPDARFTFHELLKQIKEQRYINKLLKEKNFDKLNEFALASMKEKINRSNFQQADQTVVSQFYNNISSIDNIDEVPIMNMYDGIDLNMIPELTVSLNDYVVWMKDYKKMINSVVVNRTSNTIPNFTIYDILVQLNSILKEAIRSTDNLEDNVSYLLTKYFFMPNGQEIQSWTSKDIYKQRELHRLKAGIIAILGAPNWTGFANNYWKMLGQELRMLKAWANGYAANKQEGKDNELSPIKEIQHAYLENFDDIFDLVLKSKRTFPNEGGINHIGKEYKDGDKLKPFKIKAFKGLKEGQELWIYPYKEGMGFVIKETVEGKVKNTFVYKNPQELYLAANESDYTASQIIEEIKKNAKRAMFNKEGAIEQRRNYNFNAFDDAYTEMFLFFNSFYFQTSVALEDRMELAIRKINEFSVNNPSKQVGLNYALRTLFSIPTNYTAHNSIKVFQKSNYADMLSPYDKYSDNTLIWELILNTKPELASEIAKEQSSIYTGETLTASQKIKTSIQQLMADDEVYFDTEPENKSPFLPGQEHTIKRDAFDPKNLGSAINLVSKAWYKDSKTDNYDIKLSQSDLTNDQIMNSALGFEFPNLLGQELFLPIRIKDVINIFSGSEIITEVKGLNFSQILVAKQKFFMEINRQITAMENRVNTLIDKEIKTLALNWKTENPTVLKKLKSFFNKSKQNLNADIVTSIATRVKENPFNLKIIFDEKGNALYQRGETTYNNIEDYINSLGLETSTEKALERASALYRLKYSQYARVADRMVSYIDAKILQYEQFLTDVANRSDTDNGAYGILTLLRGYKKRYVAQSKKLKNNFYPLSIPINELEHLYTIYEETKVDNFLSERWNSEYWQQFYNNFEDFKRDILFYEEQYAENFANIPEDLSYLELQIISEAVNLSQLRKPLKQYPNDIRKIALEKGWQNEVHLDLIYGMEDFVKWFWDNKIQEKISIKSLKGVQKFHNIMFGSLHNDLSYFNWLEYAYWENNKNGKEKDSKLMSNLKRFMAMQSNSKELKKEVIPLSKVQKGDTISFTYLYEYYDEGTTQTYSIPKVITGVVREVKGTTIRMENDKKSLHGLSEMEMLQKGYTRILFQEGEEFTVDDIIAKQYKKHEEIKGSQEPISNEQIDMIYDLVKLKFLEEEDIAGYRNWTQGYASAVILPAYIDAINFRWRDKGYDKVKISDIDYEEISYEYMTEEFFEIEEKKIRRRRKFLTTNIDGKEEPLVTRVKSEADPDKRSFWKDRYKVLQMLSSIWFLGGFKSGQQNWIDGSSQLVTDLGVVNWFKARFSGYTGKRKASLIEKIKEGDYTEMDNTLDKFLNQDSFTPENFDKMKLVEALTLQYVLKHDLGEQGLQASFIQDVEGGFLGKVAYTAKGFLYIFKEAEVMVRRKAAFYYSYKAVMIDGITDPNMAELVIEKGVSRTQSLYDVLYRRLGEDTDLGKLLFQFSQYGHFQWELLKQDYRISKHLDEKFKLSAYFKALLYGQHSINANRKVKYAQKLTYDVMFQTLALFFPGMRLGGAMNRTAIFMLRALITALIDQDDDETKKTTEDWINSILAIMFGIGITYPLNFVKRMIVPEKYFVEVEDENGKVELEQREKNMYESIRDNEMSFSRSAVAPSWWALGETVGKLAFKEKKYGEADRLRGYAMYKITPFNMLPYRNRYMSPKEREMGNYGLEERIFGQGFSKPTRLLEGMLPTNKFYLTSTKEEEKELKKLEEEVSKPKKGSIEEKMQKAEKKKKSKEKKSLEEKLQEKQNKK